jgi:hypothetical protein
MLSIGHRARAALVGACAAVVGLGSVSSASSSAPQASSYRPLPIAPVIRPSLPGEGVWHATGTPIEGRAPLLLTTFRPDAANPSVVAYVAWVDHTRTRLALYPGTSQPPASAPLGLGEIPFGQRWRLIATFNGGFKYGSRSGGGGGFAVDGHTLVPLERGLGTLVGYRNGRIDIVAWQGGATVGRAVSFARQNLPLLVRGGRPGPDLADPAVWGRTLGGGEIVPRTGVGIDRHGNLIYASADETVAGLAAILIKAGAVRAIELDINPEWPTFDVYAHRHGLVAAKFVPNYQQPTSRYLHPDSRDFFAVFRALGGRPATVPFR